MEHLLDGYISSSSSCHSPSDENNSRQTPEFMQPCHHGSHLHTYNDDTNALSSGCRQRKRGENSTSSNDDDHESTLTNSQANNFCENSDRGKRQRSLQENESNGLSTKVEVVVFGCNDCDSDHFGDALTFERNSPHWEGRWAGHIYLPLPSLEALDTFVAPVADYKSEHYGPNSCSDDDSVLSDIDQNDDLSLSRSFLPTVRILIHYWARLLGEIFQSSDSYGDYFRKFYETRNTDATMNKGNQNYSKEINSPVVIVPHIPMKSNWNIRNKNPFRSQSFKSTTSSMCCQPANSLHISLSRPIYIPTPSVDRFLADITKSLNNVLSDSRKSPSEQYRKEKIIHLEPSNAAIFVNDEGTRSFLTIPVSNESTLWMKSVLLPTVNATMTRFGQKTYYSTEEEECILHVSVASVKGNMVEHMMRAKDRIWTNCDTHSCNEKQIKSVSLFSGSKCKQCQRAENSSVEDLPESLPERIPIRVDRVQCRLSEVKGATVTF